MFNTDAQFDVLAGLPALAVGRRRRRGRGNLRGRLVRVRVRPALLKRHLGDLARRRRGNGQKGERGQGEEGERQHGERRPGPLRGIGHGW